MKWVNIVGERLGRFAAASLVLAAAGPTAAFAVTPANGGPAGGILTVIDAAAGDQTDPHVGGDLAAYTDIGSGTIRYYNFLDNTTSTVPSDPLTDSDALSDVNGSHISLSRVRGSGRMCIVFDVDANTAVEIAPGQGTVPYSTALGSDTVAFVNVVGSAGADIMVGSISSPEAPLTNLSPSPGQEIDSFPAVSPAGNAVVWESCESTFSSCVVRKAIRSGGAWGASQVVSATGFFEQNPDTDGATVVYESNRPSATDVDIYLQPLSGGAETPLQMAGVQRNPRISQGVVAFVSHDATGFSDVFVYVMATNMLWRVTETPGIDEVLSDISVLPNGDVRVVWAAYDDPVAGDHNVYARTFSLPGGPVVYDFTGFFPPVENLPTPNIASAGSSIAVKFSLGGDHGLEIFAPGYPASSPIACDLNEPGTEIEETDNPGGSSLTYDPASDQYTYVWKSDKSWKGTCRMLVVGLDDGTRHLAKFRFR